MALTDDVEGINYGLCKYFAVHRQQIVGWNLLQSQYYTSLSGQDKTASPPYSQDRYTAHCAWASVECIWLGWLVIMPLSYCWYVAVEKYQWWSWRENKFAELNQLYDPNNALLDVGNVIHAVRWFFRASEYQLFPTTFQTGLSGWRIPAWTALGHLMWLIESLTPADSLHSFHQPYSSWWLESDPHTEGPEFQHACWWSC